MLLIQSVVYCWLNIKVPTVVEFKFSVRPLRDRFAPSPKGRASSPLRTRFANVPSPLVIGQWLFRYAHLAIPVIFFLSKMHNFHLVASPCQFSPLAPYPTLNLLLLCSLNTFYGIDLLYSYVPSAKVFVNNV